MFQPQHFGLFCTAKHLDNARKQRDRAPLQSAWQRLEQEAATLSLHGTLRNGLLWRLDDDTAAAQRGVEGLLHCTQILQSDPKTDFEALATLTTLAQSFELLRTAPACSDQQQWQNWFAAEVHSQQTHERAHVEQLWLAALQVAAGVVLEDAALFDMGTTVYRETIERYVHPEGYIKPAVEDRKDRQGLQRLLWSVKALVLIAEAAGHAGENLWAFEQRGVGLLTAALYPLAYYFYPEKWQWDGEDTAPYTQEEVQQLFRQHGAGYELLHYRYPDQRAIRLFLDAERPLFDLYGGGYTTLTHAVVKKRGLFG